MFSEREDGPAAEVISLKSDSDKHFTLFAGWRKGKNAALRFLTLPSAWPDKFMPDSGAIL
jgi:hypothetical protein